VKPYVETPTQTVLAANGIDYAYRETGTGTPVLILLQHFRGNLDNWDPALIDALASGRRLVTFDCRPTTGTRSCSSSCMTATGWWPTTGVATEAPHKLPRTATWITTPTSWLS
jgi:pimeloyl-ACP methyl ester carboxylesterase